MLASIQNTVFIKQSMETIDNIIKSIIINRINNVNNNIIKSFQRISIGKQSQEMSIKIMQNILLKIYY